MTRKKIYVLDTSVYLTNAECIYAYKNHDIYVPLKVFEEIDGHKKRQDVVGAQARKIIRLWDELRSKGSIDKGVLIRKGLGIIKSVSAHGCTDDLPSDLDVRVPDHLIIATALKFRKQLNRKVILVSRDINMRVIADAVGLQSEDFQNNQIVDNSEKIFTGFTTVAVDDQIVDNFYEKKDVYLDTPTLYPNQYVMMVSNANEKKSALGRFISKATPIEQIVQKKKHSVWGIKARNKEQSFLLDALMDPKIQIVTAIGKAGSGKTICAIAAGLEQTIDETKQEYTRVIVSRPVQPLGKDIGFLPGTMEEKMSPWLMPIQDNLQFLMGNDKVTLDIYMQKGTIEIEALTYIRGRSISNAFIIIDEAQNLTTHELKTIITRVGEGTKIVLTGDVEQIDNVYIDATTNGLTHAVEKFKKFDLAAHVTLQKGERSKVATFAAQNL